MMSAVLGFLDTLFMVPVLIVSPQAMSFSLVMFDWRQLEYLILFQIHHDALFEGVVRNRHVNVDFLLVEVVKNRKTPSVDAKEYQKETFVQRFH